MLLIEETVDRCLLSWIQIQLSGHPLPVPTCSTTTTAAAAMILPPVGPDHTIGGKTESATGEESTKQKHQRVTLRSFHRTPQCDSTWRKVASRCDRRSLGAVTTLTAPGSSSTTSGSVTSSYAVWTGWLFGCARKRPAAMKRSPAAARPGVAQRSRTDHRLD